MQTNHGSPASLPPQPDADLVAAITREVLARLTATSTIQPADAEPHAEQINDRIVTAETIINLPGQPRRVSIRRDALVTPAAKDEASRRGISFDRNPTSTCAANPRADRGSNHARDRAAIGGALEIIDIDQPERGDTIARQLAMRGVNHLESQVVLSKRPAWEVHRQCSQRNQRAVMIGTISDVSRFAEQLQPTVWVLDTERLGLVEAVNVIAQIAKTTAVAGHRGTAGNQE